MAISLMWFVELFFVFLFAGSERVQTVSGERSVKDNDNPFRILQCFSADDGDCEQDSPPAKKPRPVLPCHLGPRRINFVDYLQDLSGKSTKQAVYMFDWDDTLFPTSELTRDKEYGDAVVIDQVRQRTAREGISAAQRLVEGASRRGIVIILTNAQPEWVPQAISRFSTSGYCNQEAYGWSDNFVIVYSRSWTREREFTKWKADAVKTMYQQLADNKIPIAHWFSVGDQPHDLIRKPRDLGLPATAEISFKSYWLFSYNISSSPLQDWSQQLQHLAAQADSVLSFDGHQPGTDEYHDVVAEMYPAEVRRLVDG